MGRGPLRFATPPSAPLLAPPAAGFKTGLGAGEPLYESTGMTTGSNFDSHWILM